jgi:antitoxin CcdA
MRAKVNLSIEEDLSAEARRLGLNMSRIAEEALAGAVKRERNRRWAEENRAALDAYAEEVAREGLALARFRTF